MYNNIYKYLQAVYCTICISYCTFCRWIKAFQAGQSASDLGSSLFSFWTRLNKTGRDLFPYLFNTQGIVTIDILPVKASTTTFYTLYQSGAPESGQWSKSSALNNCHPHSDIIAPWQSSCSQSQIRLLGPSWKSEEDKSSPLESRFDTLRLLALPYPKERRAGRKFKRWKTLSKAAKSQLEGGVLDCASNSK